MVKTNKQNKTYSNKFKERVKLESFTETRGYRKVPLPAQFIPPPCPPIESPREPSYNTQLDEGDYQEKPFVETALEAVRGPATKDLLFGTVTGWIAGFSLIKVGKIAAFGLGGGILILHFACQKGYINVNWDRVRETAHWTQDAMYQVLRFMRNHSCYSTGFAGGFFLGMASRSLQPGPPMLPIPSMPPGASMTPAPSLPLSTLQPPDPVLPEKPRPPDPTPRPSEPFKAEDPNLFLEKPFIPHKPIPHSPKISPSSIPNPSPSVTTTKQMEPGYPGYGGYMYSVPSYSAFQPISYPGIMQPNQGPIQMDNSNTDFTPFPVRQKDNIEEKNAEIKTTETQTKFEEPKHDFTKIETPKIDVPQSDTMKIVPIVDVSKPNVPQFEVPEVVEPHLEQLDKPTANLSKADVPLLDVPQEDLKTFDVPKFEAAKFDVNKPNLVVQPQVDLPKTENQNLDSLKHEVSKLDMPVTDVQKPDTPKFDTPKFDVPLQTDFEEQFTPEIIPTVPAQDPNKSFTNNESKMSITSLAQGSGATVTISSQVANKEVQKKVPERFSLKTSIPISKIDMKCVSTQSEGTAQISVAKKLPASFNPVLNTPISEPIRPEIKVQSHRVEKPTKIEIQSNVVIKKASIETDLKVPPEPKPASLPLPIPAPLPAPSHSQPNHCMSNSINALLNAAEVISKSESMFKKPESKQDNIQEIKDPPAHNFTQTVQTSRAMFNPINFEPGKVSFVTKQDTAFAEQKNPILFIQNKNNIPNSKMLLAIQQQNPQVLLQRTSFDPKNLQAPSRLLSQGKKSNEDNGMVSKVVALKRMHQENCDMNDFENLITENQIYGNKIVVKEKSQGTQQEQDLKNKNRTDRAHVATKNVVLQPNFLYVSNVPLPLSGNCMMIKNNTRITQPTEMTKVHTITLNPATPSNENKTTSEASTMTNMNDVRPKTVKQSVTVGKEIHVLKPNNNVVISNNNKTDVVFQTQQKVVMHPQIVYNVPMVVEKDKKVNQTLANNNENFKKIKSQSNKEKAEHNKPNDKLYIACVDSKSQPKIYITSIKDQIHKIEDVSALDMYERRKRLKRLKYLSNKDTSNAKPETNTKKVPDKVVEKATIITPDKIKDEVLKEFEKSQAPVEDDSSGSDSEYDDDEELLEYSNIIESYSVRQENSNEKAAFLANFKLATQEVYKDKELDRQDRILQRDRVASAYIAAGRLDRLTYEDSQENLTPPKLKAKKSAPEEEKIEFEKDSEILRQKQSFLSSMNLLPVTRQYKEGYEKIWHEIIKERKRRDCFLEPGNTVSQPKNVKLDLDTNGQLKILTEIKKSVTDNNNLIKKRLDSTEESTNEEESIRTLAEKSFSELDRVTKMADRSVKIITGQDTRKRDLNPGFDSENIQKQPVKVQQPFQNYPQINIPNLSKIISLKTDSIMEETLTSDLTSTQATSMDEPQNSAAGVNEMSDGGNRTDKVRDIGCQVDDFSCLGIDDMIMKYRQYDAARKREIYYLHRRNTALRVALAKTRRSTGHHTELARALLAERNALAAEELREMNQIERLWSAVRTVLNCQTEKGKRNSRW